jgi:hypothetical protein
MTSPALFRIGSILSQLGSAATPTDIPLGELALAGTADTAAVNALLDKLAAAADDLRTPFTRIDQRVTEGFRRQFEDNGRQFGTPWQPLRTTTIALRTRTITKRKRAQDGSVYNVVSTTNRRGEARYGFASILRNTGALYGSLAKGSSAAAFRVIGPRMYQRGTTVPYARFHQSGFRLTFFGRRTGVVVQPRPLFPRTPPAAFVQMVTDEVTTFMGGA